MGWLGWLVWAVALFGRLVRWFGLLVGVGAFDWLCGLLVGWLIGLLVGWVGGLVWFAGWFLG